MSTKEANVFKKMRSAYEALYNDLNEAATDDYNEYLWNTFGHVTDHDWTDAKAAASALRSLIDEAYESYEHPEAVMDAIGINDEVKKFLELSAKQDWVAEVAKLLANHEPGYRASVKGYIRRIPEAEFSEELLLLLFEDCSKRLAWFIESYGDVIPQRALTADLVIEMVDEHHPGDLRKLPDKSIITREVAERIVDKIGARCLSSFPMRIRNDTDFLLRVVESDPRGLSGVPKQLRTTEMCNKAILDGIKLCKENPAIYRRYLGTRLFDAQLALVPDGPNALPSKTKEELIRIAPHTIKVFAEAGAFDLDENERYSADAWNMCHAAMETDEGAQAIFSYAPTRMSRERWMREHTCTDTQEFSEIRTLSASKLRALCIEHNWYTCGDNKEYDALFNRLYDEDGVPVHLTTQKLAEIAADIEAHSEIRDYTITSIMFELNRACSVVFDENRGTTASV